MGSGTTNFGVVATLKLIVLDGGCLHAAITGTKYGVGFSEGFRLTESGRQF
jgi:hypothetical protein